jgi:hypothetical protein
LALKDEVHRDDLAQEVQRREAVEAELQILKQQMASEQQSLPEEAPVALTTPLADKKQDTISSIDGERIDASPVSTPSFITKAADAPTPTRPEEVADKDAPTSTSSETSPLTPISEDE